MNDLVDTIVKNLTPPLGSFLIIDLIAATTNAFNGALLARRPTHYRNYTVVGILLLAIFGGIGGGVSRDVLLNDVPAPLLNPYYIALCALAAGLALYLHYATSQRVREGMFRFMAALPVGGARALGASGSSAGGSRHRAAGQDEVAGKQARTNAEALPPRTTRTRNRCAGPEQLM